MLNEPHILIDQVLQIIQLLCRDSRPPSTNLYPPPPPPTPSSLAPSSLSIYRTPSSPPLILFQPPYHPEPTQSSIKINNFHLSVGEEIVAKIIWHCPGCASEKGVKGGRKGRWGCGCRRNEARELVMVIL